MDAGMQGPRGGFQETCLKGWNEAAAHRVKPELGGRCDLLSWEVAWHAHCRHTQTHDETRQQIFIQHLMCAKGRDQ